MDEDDQATSKVVFRGRIFEIEQALQPDGRTFERAVRAPGVRLIIIDESQQKLLLTQEYREELQDWDYRLPGGKVFDTLQEYDDFKATPENIERAAERKVKAEGQEEAGIQINTVHLFAKSTLGATVEWDLYIFESTDWQYAENGQKLEAGEQIEADNWFNYEEVRQMILDGHMQEGRIALVLLQWLTNQ